MNAHRHLTLDELPARLALINDAPDGLFVRGDHEPLRAPCVAIVGARTCTSYGARIAYTWAYELAAAGITIVSGLARGIDAEAHRGALDADGRTVAVLGCGIDRVYPAAHGHLHWRILECGGAVVSEYEPGTEPAPWRFPARNRIIAGLANAVVVVEAREHSGALITAGFAREHGVRVFAVPGRVSDPTSAGTNGLIASGEASLALTAADVAAAVRP